MQVIENIKNEMVCANACPEKDKEFYEQGKCTCYKGKTIDAIKELQAENERLVAESKQCHESNDELCSEHVQLKSQIKKLTKTRSA